MGRMSFRRVAFFSLMLIAACPVRAQQEKIALGGKTRPEVSFPHMSHMASGISCKDCHHVYENGQNILDESTLVDGNESIRCFACHGRKPRLNLQQAFHRQCIGCHKRHKKEKQAAGPAYCGECHVKK